MSKFVKNNNYGFKHGGTNSRLYNIYCGIKYRCFNPNNIIYNYYGGRGITVCPKWTESYAVFRDWALANGYQEGLEIDRKENNGNYEPSNCQWITHKENTQKRRTSKLTQEKVNEIRELDKTDLYTRKELAIKYNVHNSTIDRIINNKRWTITKEGN